MLIFILMSLKTTFYYIAQKIKNFTTSEEKDFESSKVSKILFQI